MIIEGIGKLMRLDLQRYKGSAIQMLDTCFVYDFFPFMRLLVVVISGTYLHSNSVCDPPAHYIEMNNNFTTLYRSAEAEGGGASTYYLPSR